MRIPDYPNAAEKLASVRAEEREAKVAKPIRRVTTEWLIKTCPSHRQPYCSKYIKQVVASNKGSKVQMRDKELRAFAKQVRKLVRGGLTDLVDLAKTLKMNPVTLHKRLRDCGVFLLTKPSGHKRFIVEDTHEAI